MRAAVLSQNRGGLAFCLIVICWLITACWAGLNAWNFRDVINPDGISYLDMAQEALRGGPAALVNSHWSPLYPALLAVCTMIVHPSVATEFPTAHALTAITHLIAACAFGFLLWELVRPRSGATRRRWIDAGCVIFGFSLFLAYTNADIFPLAVTPDLLLGASAFGAAALFLRVCRRGRAGDAVAFGCVLAAGFYAKSVMLPAGCVLCVLLLAVVRGSRARVRHIGIVAGVMFLLAMPQVVAVSLKVRHLSIGETAKLNYLWWVQGVQQFAGWTGTPRDQLLHGPRVLLDDPEVIEFAEPVPGTYPLWYDPGYWYAGAKLRFDWQKQLAALSRTADFYRSIFAQLAWPLLGLCIVVVLAAFKRRPPDTLKLSLVLWSCAVLLMYALLFNEWRYVAPWLVLLFVSAFAAIETRFVALQSIVLMSVAVLTLAPRLLDAVVATRALANSRAPSVDMQLVEDLHLLGVRRGDKIAIVGNGFAHYYAHLAGVRIIAQISDPVAFWLLDDERAAEVERALARTGAKVLIGPARPSSFQPERWVIGTQTGCSILPLRGPGE